MDEPCCHRLHRTGGWPTRSSSCSAQGFSSLPPPLMSLLLIAAHHRLVVAFFIGPSSFPVAECLLPLLTPARSLRVGATFRADAGALGDPDAPPRRRGRSSGGGCGSTSAGRGREPEPRPGDPRRRRGPVSPRSTPLPPPAHLSRRSGVGPHTARLPSSSIQRCLMRMI